MASGTVSPRTSSPRASGTLPHSQTGSSTPSRDSAERRRTGLRGSTAKSQALRQPHLHDHRDRDAEDDEGQRLDEHADGERHEVLQGGREVHRPGRRDPQGDEQGHQQQGAERAGAEDAAAGGGARRRSGGQLAREHQPRPVAHRRPRAAGGTTVRGSGVRAMGTSRDEGALVARLLAPEWCAPDRGRPPTRTGQMILTRSTRRYTPGARSASERPPPRTGRGAPAVPDGAAGAGVSADVRAARAQCSS